VTDLDSNGAFPGHRSAEPSDPFGTAALRAVVLDAWAASPARFREDANAEEALFVGGYVGRVLVELAANAADAAREAGVPAQLRVRLSGNELRVANTGAPLTPAGVAALSSLRASAKRDSLAAVGHFGVGFTAVLSWTDAPRVVSTDGGVLFDLARSQAAIAALGRPDLDREVATREGLVPVLRLPWPIDPHEDPPPSGFTTEVRLPLLAEALPDARRLLADPGTAQDLFWALPDLACIDLDRRVLRRWVEPDGLTVIADGEAVQRFRTAELTGRIPAELLADRPIEERQRAHWQISWALPIDAADPDQPPGDAFGALVPQPRAVASTVGAPTPTDEPLSLPARLVGTFPVDDTRRRLATGPLRDYLLTRAVACYLDLMAATDPGERWELLPTGGFPLGPVDGELRTGILQGFATMPLLVTALGDEVTPAAACLLPGVSEGIALFGQAVPGLLPPARGPALAALRAVGVRILTFAEASSALSGIDREPDFWWQIYEALATADRVPDPEDLADIPVPLAGGRRSLGARNCLLPAPDHPGRARPDDLGDDLGDGHGDNQRAGTDRVEVDLVTRAARVIPGLRIVDPAAAHPLLERLGARAADPDALLSDPALSAAVAQLRGELDDADPDPAELRELAGVVLDLVAAGGRSELAPLADLVLTDADGRPWPAGELLAPGAPLTAVLAADADLPLVGQEWGEAYHPDVLAAVGVRSGFGLVHVPDPLADPLSDQPGPGGGPTRDGFDPRDQLPDLDEWLDQADNPHDPLTALADLDLVDEDKWPAALALIAGDRAARECLVGRDPAGPGDSRTRLTYSGWWLSRNALIGGRSPRFWRLPGAHDLAGLYDTLPVPLDPAIARAIGVQPGLSSAAHADPQDLLDRIADPRRSIPAGRVPAVTAELVTAVVDAAPHHPSGRGQPLADLDLPAGVRTLSGEVVDAERAWVLDEPWLAQVIGADRLVPGGADPSRVAEVFDLPLASTRIRVGQVQAGPTDTENSQTPDGALERAAGALGVDIADREPAVIPGLLVSVDGAQVRVRWWGSGDRLWVDGSGEAAGRAVAWAAHRWCDRHTAIAAGSGAAVELAENGLDQ
jgi:hypothetical protein